MGLVTGISLPNNGDRIKAENYNDPINKIIAELNGNIETPNIGSVSGTKITANSLPIASLADDVAGGWFPSSDTLTYAGNAGNKEYTVTTSGDKTTKYSPGMRIKITRATTPPTQCTDLEAGSSQYASRLSASLTSITFTDDFTCEAWIKVESYPSTASILSRTSTPGTNGFNFYLDSSGRLVLAAEARALVSRQSVPLGRWVHVAASMDMSAGTGAMYMNGIGIPAAALTGAGTSFTQSGNLQIGASNGTNFFDGEIAEVRLWNTVVSLSNIQANMNITLTGSESNLLGLWKLNGNFNDSTTNANHLSAVNSATATTTDNPMKTTEYGVITKVSYSAPNTTITIFTGTDHNIPNGTLSNFSYSAYKTPFGFPAARSKWRVDVLILADYTTATPTANDWYAPGGISIAIPTGEWMAGYEVGSGADRGAAGRTDTNLSLSTSASAESDRTFTRLQATGNAGVFSTAPFNCLQPLTVATITNYYLIARTTIASISNLYIFGASGAGSSIVFAECAYL